MGNGRFFRLVFVAALACSWVVSPGRGSASPVSVEHIGADRIGRILSHEVAEEIAGSAFLSIAAADADGWKLVLLTTEKGRGAFYSVVLVRKRFEDVFDQYVIAFNGTCDAAKLSSCAREIVERVRDPIDRFEQNWRELSLPEETDGSQETAGKPG
jgi:hypothetical protein